MASRLAGINVKRITLILYTMTGTLAALSGLVMTGLASTAMPSVGESYALDTITAVYLGGNSSEGGEGSVWRTLLGVMIIGILNNGMALISVQSYWQTFIKGTLLIAAVTTASGGNSKNRSGKWKITETISGSLASKRE
ncbi:MAG: ribose transport system permease protein [Spirochaetes bacterium]|nr:MAG: ribose transport system permease protein [Spirochaetota bacterium]